MAWQQTGPVPDRKPLNAGQTRAQQATARQLKQDDVQETREWHGEVSKKKLSITWYVACQSAQGIVYECSRAIIVNKLT